MQRVAMALRPGGIVIVIDAFRPASLGQTGQVEGLLDLYFGAASGAGMWTLEEIQEWSRKAGLDTLPPRNLRRMPICTMQVARKAESFA
jgi:hypothetical protein